MTTFSTAADNATICTNRFLAFCGILSRFGVVELVVSRLGERVILQGKVATFIGSGGLSFHC